MRYHLASYMGYLENIPYEMRHPVLDAFSLNKYSIWEDHRFTRAREPVNKLLGNFFVINNLGGNYEGIYKLVWGA